MRASSTFDPTDAHMAALQGPVALVARGLQVPRTPGLYVITCGGCLAHVGTSSNLRQRLRTLATLGHHRGSPEVLCAAFCTSEDPLIRWEVHPDSASARERERELKQRYGEPPQPRSQFQGCVNGAAVLTALVEAAGQASWEAGFAEAVIAIGEELSLLFQPRFDRIWERIGVPPGPWAGVQAPVSGSGTA